MNIQKFARPPSAVADLMAFHARVAALMQAVDGVKHSVETRGIPSPESLSRLFRAERAMRDHEMYGEAHA